MKKTVFLLVICMCMLLGLTSVAAQSEASYSKDALSVMVSGKLDTVGENDYVTLLMVRKGVEIADITNSDIGYIKEIPTDDKGNYSFVFRFKYDINDYNLIINHAGEIKNDTIILAKSMHEIYDFDIKPYVSTTQVNADISIRNPYMYENAKVTIIAAIYDGENNLINTKTWFDVEIKQNAPTLLDNIAIPLTADTYYAKIMVLKDITTIMPLTKAAEVPCSTISDFKVKYPGYLDKAVTISIDDGNAVDADVIKVLNTYGVKATFNMNSTTFVNEENKDVYEGHEVANHGWGHPRMYLSYEDSLLYDSSNSLYGKGTTKQQCFNSVKTGKTKVEEIFGQDSCQGFVWPYSKPDDRDFYDELLDEIKATHSYCRPTDNNTNMRLPTDWYNWEPTCHLQFAQVYVDKFQSLSGSELDELRLLYLWGHSIDIGKTNYPELTWETFDYLCKDLGEDETIWKATNIEVCNYVKAIDALVVDERTITNPSNVDVYCILNGEKTIIPAGATVSIAR